MTEELALRALSNVEEMADMLNVSDSVVYDLARSRRIPFVKVGGVYRFEPVRVIKHLREEPEKDEPKKRLGRPSDWSVIGGGR